MSDREKPRVRAVVPTARGVVQAILGVALLVVGLTCGLFVLAAAGSALLLACATGLLEVLLSRSRHGRGTSLARLLPTPERMGGTWARLDQHGRKLGQTRDLPGERGLYRQGPSTLLWRDAFGFWLATGVEPSGREVCVPPAPNERLARILDARGSHGIAEFADERDAAGVRPYEKGDGLRRISWRQSAHHGELMSFEDAGPETPPVLVVADTLGACDADALAAAVASTLLALRRHPDVLLTDGSASWRTPVQQDRFLASLVPEAASEGEVAAHSQAVERLAAEGRRRIVLVTCDERGKLARALRQGRHARTLVVINATEGAGVTGAREGSSDGGRGSAPRGRSEQVAASALGEVVASLGCCALGALTLVPLLSLFHRGAWEAPCLAMLLVALGVGSAVPAALRVRHAPRSLRAGASALLALALVVSGLAVTSSLFEARRGFPILESTAALTQATDAPEKTEGTGEEAAPIGALVAIVADGANQLAGAQADAENEAWDLVIVLGGTAISAIAALLAGSRALRCCTAIVPLGIAVADQLVMGTVRPAWTAAVVALGLLLARVAGRPSHGAVRLGVVALLTCGLAASGSAFAWGAGATEGHLGQGGEGSGMQTAEQSGVPRIETLVDLSANLTRNSSTVALTYTTSVGRPLYLRLGVLDRFDGSEWRFSDEGSALYEEVNWSLYDGIIGYAHGEGTTFVTTIWTDGDTVPAPPGTRAERTLDERTHVMNGTYVEPLRDVADADVFVRNLEGIRGFGAPLDFSGSDHAAELEVFGSVPESVSAVVEAARADGVQGDDYVGRAEAVRWLIAYFSSEDFTYSSAAPGGDGQDNLSVIGDFLTERRGYCTHYATAFTVLARLLGVPARVVMGYLPSDTTNESGNYEVTMRQLHSWSEVWIDGIGWVGVDVTPAITSGGEAVEDLPTEPQVRPDDNPAAEEPQTPEGEGADVPEPSDEESNQAPSAGEENDGRDTVELPSWVAPLVCGAAVAAAAVLAVLLARQAQMARLRRGDWDYAWRRVCRTARRAHLSWGPEATERDVAEVICTALSDEGLARAVHQIARNACLARYGNGAHEAGAERLPNLLARLKATLKHA